MGKKSPAQTAVAEAIALRQFPPSLVYPEMGPGTLLSEWFACPTLTWAPECREPNRKPQCVANGCSCVPRVKAYKQRIVEDVEHRTVLYYARYQCTGASRKSFSTISDSYLASSKLLVLNFPYLLTYKTGISSDMFDIVYDGMLSTKGIAGAAANIVRRRQKRYYRILARAGAKVEELRLLDADYAPPLPPTEAQYMPSHVCLDSEVLKELWLTHTNILSRLCAAQITDTKCERVFRMDHSQKFCSKLKVYAADGSKEQSASIRMLLLVQNEVGQILGRTLTKSENHAETEALLQSLVPKMSSASDGPRICVCDNANSNRNLIERVFGEAVKIKQDPFHVISRFTEKVSDSAKKRWLAGQLSAAIYDVERNLRPPEECERRMKAVLQTLDPASISVNRSEWEGCVASNLAQVRLGDLYVGENRYSDAGGEISVVSTSQLEAIHSKLRKLLDRVLSIEVGLRILDIFILQHNLNVGAQHHRNPKFHGTDYRTVCQSAVMCNGLLPESPQIEYMSKLMATKSPVLASSAAYRTGAAQLTEHRPWESLFDMIHLHTNEMEANLLSRCEPAEDIRLLLSNAYVKHHRLSRDSFVQHLHLESEYEAVREFSACEFSLLKQLRADQLAAKMEWSKDAAVATILYNCAVERLDNRALNVRKRGFGAIAKLIPGIDEQLKRTPHAAGQRIVMTTAKAINDELITPDEDALMRNLFATVRTSTLKHRKQIYAIVYNFAAAACGGINPKTRALLLRRWEGLKRTQNRDKKRKRGCGDVADLVASDDVIISPRLPTFEEKPPSSSQLLHATIANVAESSSCAASLSTAQSAAKPANDLPGTHVGATSSTSDHTPNENISTHIPTAMIPASAYQIQRWDSETEAHLRQIAAVTGKGSKGKWALIHQEYLKRYSGSTMAKNAVRMRLRERRITRSAAPAVLPATAPAVAMNDELSEQVEQHNATEAPSIGKRPTPACPSCKSRKRRCGPSSDNERCQFRQTTQRASIASFFSLPSIHSEPTI